MPDYNYDSDIGAGSSSSSLRFLRSSTSSSSSSSTSSRSEMVSTAMAPVEFSNDDVSSVASDDTLSDIGGESNLRSPDSDNDVSSVASDDTFSDVGGDRDGNSDDTEGPRRPFMETILPQATSLVHSTPPMTSGLSSSSPPASSSFGHTGVGQDFSRQNGSRPRVNDLNLSSSDSNDEAMDIEDDVFLPAATSGTCPPEEDSDGDVLMSSVGGDSSSASSVGGDHFSDDISDDTISMIGGDSESANNSSVGGDNFPEGEYLRRKKIRSKKISAAALKKVRSRGGRIEKRKPRARIPHHDRSLEQQVPESVDLVCHYKHCNRRGPFASKRNYVRHYIQQHIQVTVLHCPVKNCKSIFTREDNLREHKRSHEGVRFYCEQTKADGSRCGANFSLPQGLSNHKRRHHRNDESRTNMQESNTESEDAE